MLADRPCRVALVVALAACVRSPHWAHPRDPAAQRGEWPRTVYELHDIDEAGDRAERARPGWSENDPEAGPPGTRTGPKRGLGCKCRRLTCRQITPGAVELRPCYVFVAGVKHCFTEASVIGGEAFVVIKTDRDGAPIDVAVSADRDMTECVENQFVNMHFRERPNATFVLQFNYSPRAVAGGAR